MKSVYTAVQMFDKIIEMDLSVLGFWQKKEKLGHKCSCNCGISRQCYKRESNQYTNGLMSITYRYTGKTNYHCLFSNADSYC